jgi:hypothetical protein
MSGVAVVRYLLANNAAVLAALGAGPPVAASRVIAGGLPLNTVMPAIAVMEIDSQPRNTVAMTEANKLHTERVQVSVLFKGPQGTPSGTGLPGVKGVLALLLAAVPHTHGTVNGVNVVSILPDNEGPDLQDVATSLYQGSRDFIVRWKS